MISDIFREILKAMYCLCYKLAYEMYYAQFTYHFCGYAFKKALWFWTILGYYDPQIHQELHFRDLSDLEKI